MNASDLTFGIEIECVVPTAAMHEADIEVGRYHAGTPVRCMPAGWKASSDGSISAPNGFTAVEFVSPILKGAEGLESVRQVVAKLNELGAQVNYSTGLHIHVGVSRDIKVVKNVIRFAAQHECAIFASTGDKRRERNHYTKPISEIYTAVKDVKDFPQLNAKIAATQIDRYRSLNLVNLTNGTRNTVEFRAFAGTLDALQIFAHIQMCVGLVHKAHVFKATPAFKRAKAPTTGVDCMKRLFTILKWNINGGFGVLETETIKAVQKKLIAQATSYDAAP